MVASVARVQIPEGQPDAQVKDYSAWDSRLVLVRVIAYVLIISSSLAVAYVDRHVIFSDGISYIQIAFAYLKHDWPLALNSYWNPLYSWIIAGLLWILKPGIYWQAATLHIVNLLAYLLGLGALELLIRELVKWKTVFGQTASELPDFVLYVAAYTSYPIITSGLIHYNSPDALGVVFMLLLTSQILKVARAGGTSTTFLYIGVICALFFLARSAFGPIAVLSVGTVLLCLRLQVRPLLNPALLMAGTFVVMCAPYVILISRLEGHFTLGEAGPLSYGWEVSGASRFVHWQGEPGNIGTPLHPTKKVSESPAAFTFEGPVGGVYPPWTNPSYWYAGLHPSLKIGAQLRAVAKNSIVLAKALLLSPVPASILLIAILAGPSLFFKRWVRFWPAMIPVIGTLGLYSLVYVERRYIVPCLLITWLLLVASLSFGSRQRRRRATAILVSFCGAGFCLFFYVSLSSPILKSLTDLMSHKEHNRNENAVIAEQLRRLGLATGSKVAFIGMSTNADWGRLDQLRIVGEVPVVWERPTSLRSNILLENSREIRGFWSASNSKQEQILGAFRRAGATMVLTDGMYVKSLPSTWSPVFPGSVDGIPLELTSKFRYKWLVTPSAQQ